MGWQLSMLPLVYCEWLDNGRDILYKYIMAIDPASCLERSEVTVRFLFLLFLSLP